MPTPAPGNPVHQIVTCQYAITVALSKAHDLSDKNHANVTVSRTIHINVPLP